MLPGAAGLQSVAVLGEQTHEGLVILSAAPYGASDRVLVAVAPQCPRKPGGRVVWSVLGHSVSPGSPFFKHPPVLQAWGRHKMEQGRHGDAVRAPSTRWQAETSPLSALVPCQGKGSPCAWGAAGLRVPRTGCPAPVPRLLGGQFLLRGAGKTNASQLCPQSLARPQMKNSSLSRCSVLPLLLP